MFIGNTKHNEIKLDDCMIEYDAVWDWNSSKNYPELVAIENIAIYNEDIVFYDDENRVNNLTAEQFGSYYELIKKDAEKKDNGTVTEVELFEGSRAFLVTSFE